MIVQTGGSKPQTVMLQSASMRTPVDQPVHQPESTPVPAMRNWRELDRLEREGVRLSIGEEQIVRAIETALKALEGPSTMFEMRVHEETRSIIVRVLNRETGELIREIPPEKTLDLVVKMMEFAGLLVDERV
ncbi:Flagellar protein FlaG protein [Thermobacillus xylanilyticus]|uniref:Flagellar protein FlaG protein n=1 Tax=Thermobacillus xylanilyticus TaxID=76633 RepID=A0ABM8V5D0_THEXY|nr:flagellar protein FlaG [Thermobacillus xylanilyticus]CAG5088527.1 Flagellar protein FlaG protein [Thermobacillus xylanilyticus]